MLQCLKSPLFTTFHHISAACTTISSLCIVMVISKVTGGLRGCVYVLPPHSLTLFSLHQISVPGGTDIPTSAWQSRQAPLSCLCVLRLLCPCHFPRAGSVVLGYQRQMQQLSVRPHAESAQWDAPGVWSAPHFMHCLHPHSRKPLDYCFPFLLLAVQGKCGGVPLSLET